MSDDASTEEDGECKVIHLDFSPTEYTPELLLKAIESLGDLEDLIIMARHANGEDVVIGFSSMTEADRLALVAELMPALLDVSDDG